MRGYVALLTLAGCLAAFGPAQAQAAARAPRFELGGDWSFHGDKYRFSGQKRVISGRSLTSVRIGKCVVAKGTLVFRGYRFSATHGGSDYWKGRVTVLGKHCKRRLVSSTIKVESDLGHGMAMFRG